MSALLRFPPLLVAFTAAVILAALSLSGARAPATEEPSVRAQGSVAMPDLPDYDSPHAPDDVVVVRDPFVGPDGSHAAAELGRAQPAGEQAAWSSGSASTPAAVTLLATALGSRPCAIVNDAGSVRIVRAGDALAGSTVSAIHLGSLSLEDGTTLRVGAP